jgi:hypothetical protein
MPEEPKLIIDSDWKSQAQAEKERLAKATAPKEGGPAGAPGQREEVRFEDLVTMLATQALSYMGYFPDPRTGQAVVSLEYARLHIDLLEVLEQKTKNNLSAEEQSAITATLSELRMGFVELQQAVAKAVQEGRVRPVSAGGAGGGLGAGPGAGLGGGMVAGGARPSAKPMGADAGKPSGRDIGST